jgi:hypothetical protein
LLSLTELRKRWRASAIRAFGACTVYRLAERARAAAVAVWARVRPVVDITLAAIDVADTGLPPLVKVFGDAAALMLYRRDATAPGRPAPPGRRRSCLLPLLGQTR